MFCNDVLQKDTYQEVAKPVLAIQPSSPTTYIAVAVRQTVYFGVYFVLSSLCYSMVQVKATLILIMISEDKQTNVFPKF